jgi:hypothetical protein
MGFDRDKVFDAIGMRRGKKNVFFSFLTDKELFDYAASVVDSVARAPKRKPIFAHIATNQMHCARLFPGHDVQTVPLRGHPGDRRADAEHAQLGALYGSRPAGLPRPSFAAAASMTVR